MTQESHYWVFTKKKYKNTNPKRYMHRCVYCSIIYNSQTMETAQVSIDRWLDKEVHTMKY